MLKDATGAYRSLDIEFEEAIRRRATIFTAAVSERSPDVVVVDRHPFGTAGELVEGLSVAHRAGVRLVLGLRDVLDEPEVVRAELGGKGWEGAGELYDRVLVYGARHICDHEAEYGLPLTPIYCGWVVGRGPPPVPTPGLLAVCAGGGGDGAHVLDLGLAAIEGSPGWRARVAAGPFGDGDRLRDLVRKSPARGRVVVSNEVKDCGPLLSTAAAVLEMAGYNSTCEALASGLRPILVPRRAPRREQAIRAERLAALDLCDVVPEGAGGEFVVSLLRSPRRLTPTQLTSAGISLDGSTRAARALEELALGART
ncbi:MAG: hypothetical protein QOD63_2896 [Actinomycetota bacterium]|nr:hypothetical protein [Actinomycetota bacterium]